MRLPISKINIFGWSTSHEEYAGHWTIAYSVIFSRTKHKSWTGQKWTHWRSKRLKLAAKVAAMTQEVAQKNEDIRRYKVEQTVVMNQTWDLVGNLGEIVNKAHLTTS